MSASYTAAVKEYLPNIPIVFDRYHVMALVGRKIDLLRREQQNVLADKGKKTLKGPRFLLLRNYQSLSDGKQKKLDKLLEANQPLLTMHVMKKQLRLFWKQRTKDRAERFLKQWVFDTLVSGIKQLIPVGMTILRRMKGLVSSYPHKISNGPLEGPTTKSKR